MLTRRLLLACTLVGGLLFPAAASSQTVEETAVDTARPPAAKPRQDDKQPDLAAVAQGIMRRTNAFRQAEGRQPVTPHPQLMQTARDFARFMARTDRYGHTADGRRPAERARQHGYTYCIVSENIATSYSSTGSTTETLAERFTQGWQHSPGHRKNMLDPDVTETGVAVARSPQSGYYYAVQMFGRPRTQQLTFQIANRSNTSVEYTIGENTLPLPPRATRTHQRCRPAEVTLQWPDTQEQTTVQPQDGSRYTIVQEDTGTFRLRRE
jgi:uncharacterized protein YkwD